MSGSERGPVIDLRGSSMWALALAIPAIASRTGREVVVIGGLAVVCRLTRPYRATSDLDTVNRRGTNEPAQRELLLASGAEASGVSSALVPTWAGLVQVDVLEVTDAELADLPDDPRIASTCHPTGGQRRPRHPMLIRARGMPDLSDAVAEPGPLIAMKLQSIMNRGAAKEDRPARHRPPQPGSRRRPRPSISTRSRRPAVA